jgi:uncharacterized membrane protein
MKKTISIILWTFTALIVGFVIASFYAVHFSHLPPHPSPEAQREAKHIGFVVFSGVYALPIVTLILGIFGVLPGTKRRKD